MGQWVSICLGVYYTYGFLRSGFSALFSCHVLYQEHGLSPSLLWGLGVGRNMFPMRFYRRWRRFQAAQRRPEEKRVRRRRPDPPPRPNTIHHEYLLVQPNVSSKRSSTCKSSLRSSLYPTLEEKYVKGTLPEAPVSIQPVAMMGQERVIDTEVGLPLVRGALVPATLPAPSPADSTVPPGPIGEVLHAGTLKWSSPK